MEKIQVLKSNIISMSQYFPQQFLSNLTFYQNATETAGNNKQDEKIKARQYKC